MGECQARSVCVGGPSARFVVCDGINNCSKWMTEVWLSKPQSTVEVKGLLGLNNNFARHHYCKWSVIVIQGHSEWVGLWERSICAVGRTGLGFYIVPAYQRQLSLLVLELLHLFGILVCDNPLIETTTFNSTGTSCTMWVVSALILSVYFHCSGLGVV